MRHCLLLLSSLLLAACAPRPGTIDPSLPSLRANDNRAAAGTLQDGVLKLKLEVTEGDWQAERALPAYRIFAFAESGKDATTPGPLIRVPQGTLIDVAFTAGSARTCSFTGCTRARAARGRCISKLTPRSRRAFVPTASAPTTTGAVSASRSMSAKVTTAS